MIIAVEGIDASGKATHTKRIVKAIQAEEIPSKRFDFPHYSSYCGQALLMLLKREWFACRPGREGAEADVRQDEAMTALTIQALMTVNRYEHLETLQEWENSEGEKEDEGVLVLDRYYGSGIAYGEADGLDSTFLRNIHRGLPCADLWLFIDIPPEESVVRRPDRRDEYETRAGFMGKVRERYIDLFKKNPTESGPFVVINGVGTEDQVFKRIWKQVEKHVLADLR